MRSKHSGSGHRYRGGPIQIALILAALLAPGADAVAQIDPSRSMRLDWTAPGDDGNVGRVASYQLRYHTVPPTGSEEELIAWWDGVPSAQRITWNQGIAWAGQNDSIRVTGLAPSTTYYFVIRAYDDVGNTSGLSNLAQGTTAPPCSAPSSEPSNFTAEPDTGEVSVSWESPDEAGVVSFHLYRATSPSGAWTLIANLPVGAETYTDRSVAAGGTYRYQAAWMGSACEGPLSAVRTVTLPGNPSTPVSSAASSPAIRVYPNPSSGPVTLEIRVSAASARHARIRVYDTKGRWIAQLTDAVHPPGVSTVTWDRKSRTGETVGPGHYQLVGVIGDHKVHETLVLVP